MTRRVFVTEDDPDILEIVVGALRREGFEAEGFARAEAMIERIGLKPPDAVVLDVMLPGMDGFEALRRLKSSSASAVPVVLLTARGEDPDVVTGLELGADDYVAKPFSPRVLVARVRAAIRRANEKSDRLSGGKSAVAKAGPIVLDEDRREVRVEGAKVGLTATEFSILALLMKHPGIAFARSRIIDSVKGDDYPVTDRSVDVQVLSLRRKLGESGELIETVRGVGYRMADPE